MMDIMNNCGRYHFFVSDQKTAREIIPAPFEIDVFVPRWLPGSFRQRRLNLRINSGWHQVDHIATDMTTTKIYPIDWFPMIILKCYPMKITAMRVFLIPRESSRTPDASNRLFFSLWVFRMSAVCASGATMPLNLSGDLISATLISWTAASNLKKISVNCVSAFS